MCIIAYKPEGVEPLKKKVFKTCFENNDDGAGFCYWDKTLHKWVIEKGFMKWKHFWRAYNKHQFKAEDIVAVHFRVATSGLTDGGNTHPYPASQDPEVLRAMYLETDTVIIHNGVVGFGEKVLSDTGAHIRDVVEPMMRYFPYDEDLKPIMDELLESAKCRWFIATDEQIWLFGTWKEDFNGVKFSNDSYKPRVYSTTGRSYTHRPYESQNNWGSGGRWGTGFDPDDKNYWLRTGTSNAIKTWERDDNAIGDAKKSDGNYVDARGTVLIQRAKSMGAKTRRVLMCSDSGELKWEEPEDTLVNNLCCPYCFNDKHMLSADAGGHTIGDTICCECGAVFDDHTGFIHMFDADVAMASKEEGYDSVLI